VAGTRPYAEKIMIVDVGQVTPWHFHAAKQEDIINRGGGILVIELCNSNADLQLLATDVQVSVDGVRRTVPARGRVSLGPGESITLYQGLAHTFYAEKGRTLVGEVSSVNDDETDNYFIQPAGRFPAIDEDEDPLYLLCTEYPEA
jgi:D-lyxose ketol-isomerase